MALSLITRLKVEKPLALEACKQMGIKLKLRGNYEETIRRSFLRYFKTFLKVHYVTSATDTLIFF